MEELKRCSRCRQSKTVSEFSKDRSQADGWSVWCLDCYKWGRDRFDHLDLDVGQNISLHSVIVGERIRATDESWEKVCTGMAWLLHDEKIKPAHVDVLMMHAVENMGFSEIGDMVGMSKDSVYYYYRTAIRKLREVALENGMEIAG